MFWFGNFHSWAKFYKNLWSQLLSSSLPRFYRDLRASKPCWKIHSSIPSHLLSVLTSTYFTCHKGETVLPGPGTKLIPILFLATRLMEMLPDRIMRVSPLWRTNLERKHNAERGNEGKCPKSITSGCVLGMLVKGWCPSFDGILSYEISAVIWYSVLFIFGHYVTSSGSVC